MHLRHLQQSIDLFHNNFSPSGKQPEPHKLAHELSQPTACCIAIFHKYYGFKKNVGYNDKFDSAKSLGYVTDVPTYHNAGIWSTFYVQKHIAARVVLS